VVDTITLLINSSSIEGKAAASCSEGFIDLSPAKKLALRCVLNPCMLNPLTVRSIVPLCLSGLLVAESARGCDCTVGCETSVNVSA